MALTAATELKGTYDEAYDHSKELLTTAQKDNLERFSRNTKDYYATAAADTDVTDEVLQDGTTAGVTVKKNKEITLVNKNAKDIVISNGATPLVASDGTANQSPAPDYEIKPATGDGTVKIKFLKDVVVAANEKLTVDYKYNTTVGDKAIVDATKEAIDTNGKSVEDLYTAYISMIKGPDGARGTADDLDTSTLDTADQEGLKQILIMILGYGGTTESFVQECLYGVSFEVKADPNTPTSTLTYTYSNDQQLNVDLKAAVEKDTQNAKFFKMMLDAETDDAKYDNTIAMEILSKTMSTIEEEALNASNTTPAYELSTRNAIVGDAEYTAEKDARKLNITSMLDADPAAANAGSISEYSYGIGKIGTTKEGENADPLKNFENLYKKAYAITDDTKKIDFDTLFKEDTANAGTFEAVTKIKEYIGTELDKTYNKSEYETQLTARETAITTAIPELKEEKFYQLKMDGATKIDEIRKLDVADRLKTDALNTAITEEQITLFVTDLLKNASAYDPTASEPLKKFLTELNDKTDVKGMQEVIYNNLKDDADKTAFESANGKSGAFNGKIGFETVRYMVKVINNGTDTYDTKEKLEAAIKSFKGVTELTALPPAECVDNTGALITDKRAEFKKTLDVYNAKAIDRKLVNFTDYTYNDSTGASKSTLAEFKAIFANHRGDVTLKNLDVSDAAKFDQAFLDSLGTNVGAVTLVEPSNTLDLSVLMSSRTVTDITLQYNVITDNQATGLAKKMNGTINLNDLNIITLTQAQKFGPQSTATLSMTGIKEITDVEVAKHFCTNKKVLVLDPAIKLPTGYKYDATTKMIVEGTATTPATTTAETGTTNTGSTAVNVTENTKTTATGILAKVNDALDKGWNETAAETKFNEVVSVVYSNTTDTKYTDLQKLLEAGDLNGFQTKVGTSADGMFGPLTLAATQTYLGLPVTVVTTPAATPAAVDANVNVAATTTETTKDAPKEFKDTVAGVETTVYFVGTLDANNNRIKGKTYSTNPCVDSKLLYDGEWKDNKMDGTGTYTRADGTKYVGKRKEGKMEGEGTYTNKKGVEIKGTREGDKLMKIKSTDLKDGMEKSKVDELLADSTIKDSSGTDKKVETMLA